MRLIDADAMIKRLKEWDTEDPMDRTLYNFALNRILEQPTIESKKGLWIKKEFPLPLSDGSKIAYECSCCKTHWDYESNYCPYCGAHMEVENEYYSR